MLWLYYMMFVRLGIFRDNYRLTTVDLTFQKTLNALAIQQIVFQGVPGQADNTEKILYTFFSKIKLNNLRKEQQKFCENI